MLSSLSRTSIAKAIECIQAQIEALINDYMIHEIDHGSLESSWISCFFEGLKFKFPVTCVLVFTAKHYVSARSIISLQDTLIHQRENMPSRSLNAPNVPRSISTGPSTNIQKAWCPYLLQSLYVNSPNIPCPTQFFAPPNMQNDLQ
jgi:hypothetical protein